MVLYNQAEWLAELARLRHARNFTCLLEARHLPGLLAHEHHNCFFSSENDLRSTDGPGLAKVRHQLASEAFKRCMHAASSSRIRLLTCSVSPNRMSPAVSSSS